MNGRNSFRLAALFLIILSLFFYGCGKKGDPRPPKQLSAISERPSANGHLHSVFKFAAI